MMENPRVIKAHALRELGQKVLFDFEDFHKRCDDRLSQTREQVEQYLAEAQQNAVSLEEQAKKKGFEAGYAAGMQKAVAEIKARAEAQTKSDTARGLEAGRKILESLAKGIADARLEWLSSWEAAAIELCVSIAEKVLRAELANRPELSENMIRQLLEVASSEHRLIARVHPEDAPSLDETAEASPRFPRFRQTVEVRPDSSLNRGDCIIELEQGQVDGRVATQLARIAQELVAREEESGDA